MKTNNPIKVGDKLYKMSPSGVNEFIVREITPAFDGYDVKIVWTENENVSTTLYLTALDNLEDSISLYRSLSAAM